VSAPYLSARREPGDSVGVQRIAIEDPWSIGQRVFRRDVAALDCEPEGPGTDADERRCLGQIHPSFGFAPLARIDGDLMVTAQRSNPLLSPEVTPTGSQVIAIEHAGDQHIRTDASELTHGINRFG
jgi:hypothetical protein